MALFMELVNKEFPPLVMMIIYMKQNLIKPN